MVEPGRKFVKGVSKYRYGFNGKEQDKETTGTSTYDYGFRIYNPALGRFLSVDPITSKYPELTPYQFASNRPIEGIDLDGLEFAPPYKSFVQKTPGTLINQAIVKTLINKPVALAFKSAFSTELPKKFIDRYASESGRTYKLNDNELKGLHVLHVGIHGGTEKDIKKADIFLSSINPGESKPLPEKYSILSFANEAGTIGTFTLRLRGIVTKDKIGSWMFKGEMQFFDKYDFKTQPKKNDGADIDRPEFANKQTDIAEKYLPGKPFNVTSDWIPIKQDSKKNNSFTWFYGKSEEVIPARVTPVQEAESKKTTTPKS